MHATAEILTQHGIRPSLQRTTVLRFLRSVKTHPTVDEIYQALLPENPSLSRTTVYNTLELLCGHGLVSTLDFGEGFLRYDAVHTPHCHFKCSGCGRVFDIMTAPPDGLGVLPEGFVLKAVQLKFLGLCKKCSRNEKAK
ncbi:MAG: transcriptional repressor [Fibrobacter sp.]|nr:transcriptional repressor [Fibrobacter sp.]